TSRGRSSKVVQVILQRLLITIHPHVMSQDGKEGILLGDTFVIEKEGPRNLSRTVCNLECL
ncbi:MAG: hypothetical protein QME90_05480, partial [Thermodesulfobacteriota bacterium]|nr:hypothetical protein [Thermodesulfobacteriota bacterium]